MRIKSGIKNEVSLGLVLLFGIPILVVGLLVSIYFYAFLDPFIPFWLLAEVYIPSLSTQFEEGNKILLIARAVLSVVGWLILGTSLKIAFERNEWLVKYEDKVDAAAIAIWLSWLIALLSGKLN